MDRLAGTRLCAREPLAAGRRAGAMRAIAREPPHAAILLSGRARHGAGDVSAHASAERRAARSVRRGIARRAHGAGRRGGMGLLASEPVRNGLPEAVRQAAVGIAARAWGCAQRVSGTDGSSVTGFDASRRPRRFATKILFPILVVPPRLTRSRLFNPAQFDAANLARDRLRQLVELDAPNPLVRCEPLRRERQDA